MKPARTQLPLSAPLQRVAQAQRPFVIVNPRARRASSAVAELVRQCRQLGIEAPVSLATTRAEPGSAQARQAIAARADLVVVIGGDGTIRQVARELAGSQLRMAIIALGSGNVLAHNLDLAGRELAHQVRVALGVHTAHIDIGQAALTKSTGQVIHEPFCTMAGIGRDAQAVAATRFAMKRQLGWGAYVVAGMRQVLARPLPMSVQIGELPARHTLSWTVLVGLAPRAPGGVIIYPDAAIDDGRLSVLEVPIRHPGQWLPVAVKGLWAPSLRANALHYQEADQVRVRPVAALPVQLDGDVFLEVVELSATIQRRALQVQVAPTQGELS